MSIVLGHIWHLSGMRKFPRFHRQKAIKLTSGKKLRTSRPISLCFWYTYIMLMCSNVGLLPYCQNVWKKNNCFLCDKIGLNYCSVWVSAGLLPTASYRHFALLSNMRLAYWSQSLPKFKRNQNFLLLNPSTFDSTSALFLCTVVTLQWMLYVFLCKQQLSSMHIKLYRYPYISNI